MNVQSTNRALSGEKARNVIDINIRDLKRAVRNRSVVSTLGSVASTAGFAMMDLHFSRYGNMPSLKDIGIYGGASAASGLIAATVSAVSASSLRGKVHGTVEGLKRRTGTVMAGVMMSGMGAAFFDGSSNVPYSNPAFHIAAAGLTAGGVAITAVNVLTLKKFHERIRNARRM
ncbi:MAG: hypothetical protein KGI00_01190 [Candidatus Micrarchaeota archaeon]|nr:hypothetical protein [Candidatus Micrarchaeota archaeon]MDE1849323.1 hypothetical protein [Candidatus Micrarchaeota archaeon]